MPDSKKSLPVAIRELDKALCSAKTPEEKLVIAEKAMKAREHCNLEGLLELAFKYGALSCRAEWEIAHSKDFATGRIQKDKKSKIKKAFQQLSREELEERLSLAKDDDIVPSREWFLKRGWIGGSGVEEYYTPAYIVEAARKSFINGKIDLDPASCAFAQKVVKAKRYFTKEDDGLKHNWSGAVFVNPPFSQLKAFAEKLIRSPDVKEAVFVGRMDIGTEWGQNMLLVSNCLCVPKKRISFYGADGKPLVKNNMANIIFGYRIENTIGFCKAFEGIGQVVNKQYPYLHGDKEFIMPEFSFPVKEPIPPPPIT